jgi:fluoroacetyl-CoA thioesterase
VAALEPGLVGEVTREVTDDISAHSMGNEDVHVLGTPALMMLIEQAAIRAIEPTFAAGQSSVGTLLNVRHLAATPVGMSVTARARLVDVDGRRLTYEVEAHDDREQVASGTHERFLVDMARFLSRVAEKARG